MSIFHYYTLDIQNMIYDTVESPVRNQPKCEDLVVTYGLWSFRRNEPQRVFFPRRRHTLWKTGLDNLFDAISKLHYV